MIFSWKLFLLVMMIEDGPVTRCNDPALQWKIFLPSTTKIFNYLCDGVSSWQYPCIVTTDNVPCHHDTNQVTSSSYLQYCSSSSASTLQTRLHCLKTINKIGTLEKVSQTTWHRYLFNWSLQFPRNVSNRPNILVSLNDGSGLLS